MHGKPWHQRPRSRKQHTIPRTPQVVALFAHPVNADERPAAFDEKLLHGCHFYI
jgi:hypothetical protein